MDPNTRTRRPIDGPEKTMLEAFLDFQRETLLWKVSGLDEAVLRRALVPSGTSLLGLVQHLAYVERWWFQAVFAGWDVDIPWLAADPTEEEWRPAPGQTPEAVMAFYRREIARSREITAAGSLEDRARMLGRRHTLRRVLIHMIEETARHVGHTDILRELTDGATGE